jgi:hypothetical protein
MVAASTDNDGNASRDEIGAPGTEQAAQPPD